MSRSKNPSEIIGMMNSNDSRGNAKNYPLTNFFKSHLSFSGLTELNSSDTLSLHFNDNLDATVPNAVEEVDKVTPAVLYQTRNQERGF